MLSEEHAEAHIMEVHKSTDRKFWKHLTYSRDGLSEYRFQERDYIYRASEMFLEFQHYDDEDKVLRMSYLDAEKLYCELLFKPANTRVS